MRYKISEIEKIYPNWYNPDSNLSYDDQKWIWENISLPEEDEIKIKKLREENENVSVNGNENGTYKNEINSESIWYKSRLIFQLKQLNSETPPSKIAFLLEEIFKFWPSRKGHWLWIAQRYTPRTINWVMGKTIKEYLRGGIKRNPPAYFTYLIKFRKNRRIKKL